MPLPEAVFFDFDGTLIDTEHLYAIAGGELVTASGHEWTQAHIDAAVGTALDDFAVQLQDAGVRKREEEIIGHVVDRVNDMIVTEDVWRQGAVELLQSVAGSGVPFGLVTMGYRETVDRVLDRPGVPEFPVIVTGDTVTRGKPHPEAYLRAAEALGVDPAASVALEDSVLGLTAAGAAGMRRIAVPPTGGLPEELFDVWWPSLVGRSMEDVTEAFLRGRV
ncbi:HAD family hydrolase [Corynebacterium provencense]|uniref:HAD family hydrolase n=1 Tax=Corynebacterium provencense TaxID=1737425 RepID=UPI000831F5B8|nr:HAD family hydrolase [Corynebacterium provencense]